MPLLRFVERAPDPAHRRRLRAERAVEAAIVVVLVTAAVLLVVVLSW